MDQNEKVIVYYSYYNYEAKPKDLSHIAEFCQCLLETLGNQWHQNLTRELQFLNIRLAPLSLEFCAELYLSLQKNSLPLDFWSFKYYFCQELAISKIWTDNNPECYTLENLLRSFLQVAWKINTQDLSQVDFKLLPSVNRAELCPLIVAKEATANLSTQFYRVLKRASMPLESIIGPESLQSISSYLHELSNRALTSFQVTSQFVTNIVEFSAENVRVRVIQPARDFYDKALEVWMSFVGEVNSTAFVLKIRETLGSMWNERLLNPSLHFFSIAEEEWVNCKEFGIDYFVSQVQKRLFEVWKENIIEASRNFKEHMLPKTVV